MEQTPTTPYLVRAIHEWCEDNALTPHLLVVVTSQTHVPMAYVKDGEIVLNISYGATKALNIGNDHITFSARFGGQPYDLYIPMNAVKGIFSRENGQGMFFEVEVPADEQAKKPFEVVSDQDDKPVKAEASTKKSKKPTLKVIK